MKKNKNIRILLLTLLCIFPTFVKADVMNPMSETYSMISVFTKIAAIALLVLSVILTITVIIRIKKIKEEKNENSKEDIIQE